jgi:hypothetical protein
MSLNHISMEVLSSNRFVSSIQCCVPLPFSEYHISGAVKHQCQWIIDKVILSGYAVPNEYARSGFEIQLLSFLFRIVHEGQVT